MISPDLLTVPHGGQGVYGGKTADELIGDDVKVSPDGEVTGTLKYVEGYTGFSTAAEEQEGNFFPFTLARKGSEMTFIKNDSTKKENISWEADNVFRVTAPTDTFEVQVDGEKVVKLTFDKATLNKKQGG